MLAGRALLLALPEGLLAAPCRGFQALLGRAGDLLCAGLGFRLHRLARLLGPTGALRIGHHAVLSEVLLALELRGLECSIDLVGRKGNLRPPLRVVLEPAHHGRLALVWDVLGLARKGGRELLNLGLALFSLGLARGEGLRDGLGHLFVVRGGTCLACLEMRCRLTSRLLCALELLQHFGSLLPGRLRCALHRFGHSLVVLHRRFPPRLEGLGRARCSFALARDALLRGGFDLGLLELACLGDGLSDCAVPLRNASDFRGAQGIRLLLGRPLALGKLA
mmetsp:Transcript_12920/g.37945  ORF Transcript_12920/g.37945 Transcript_12920/m.37945 type:complete len:278 (-) Transcript_12920:318-1151(-)